MESTHFRLTHESNQIIWFWAYQSKYARGEWTTLKRRGPVCTTDTQCGSMRPSLSVGLWDRSVGDPLSGGCEWERRGGRRYQVVSKPPGEQWLRDGHEQQEVNSSLGATGAGFAPCLCVRVGRVAGLRGEARGLVVSVGGLLRRLRPRQDLHPQGFYLGKITPPWWPPRTNLEPANNNCATLITVFLLPILDWLVSLSSHE